MTDQPERWLIAEYCSHAIYMGWHLYLRDSCEPRTRNADGGWGWIRHSSFNRGSAHSVLASLGITMREGGDGTCDDDGYAELARRYRFGRQQTGGKPRGGVRVIAGHSGIALAEPQRKNP